MQHDLENSKDSMLLFAPNIPQVYIAVRLIAELQNQGVKNQVTVYTQNKHADHFFGFAQLDLRFDFPRERYGLVVFIGHSYFLDKRVLEYLRRVAGSRVWINAHFENNDLQKHENSYESSRVLKECFDTVFCESESDEKRLSEYGFELPQLYRTFSLKYDCAGASPQQKSNALNKLVELGFVDKPLIVAASTVCGDETLLITDAFAELRDADRGVKFVIAPRSLEQVKFTVKQLESKGLRVVLESQSNDEQADILLLDCVGSLKGYFHLATAAVMGRSFTGQSSGGSNLIEPACECTPIIVGAQLTPECQHIQTFLDANAVKIASTTQELKFILQMYLTDEDLRKVDGVRAHQLCWESAGGIERVCRILKSQFLSNST